jgi:hypothetical protein
LVDNRSRTYPVTSAHRSSAMPAMQAGSRRHGCASGGLLALGAFGKFAVDCPHLSLDRHVCGECEVIMPRFACSSRLARSSSAVVSYRQVVIRIRKSAGLGYPCRAGQPSQGFREPHRNPATQRHGG